MALICAHWAFTRDENDEEIEQKYRGREKLGPGDVRTDSVLSDIEQINWSGAKAKVHKMHNIKRINYMCGKAVRQQNTDCNSFKAVSIIKEGSDSVDKFYIYKINSQAMNGEPGYVFTTSTAAAEAAINMDVSSSIYNAMQDEVVYFDGTHTRVKGFKTLLLWVYHIAMHKILHLATMEVQAESTQHIAYFWLLFNDVLV